MEPLRVSYVIAPMDEEGIAIDVIRQAMERLDPAARARVANYTAARYGKEEQ